MARKRVGCQKSPVVVAADDEVGGRGEAGDVARISQRWLAGLVADHVHVEVGDGNVGIRCGVFPDPDLDLNG